MSEFLFVSPQVLNLLARGVTTLSTGTANSLHPITNAYNGQPSKPLILSAAGSYTITVDGDLTQGYGAIEGTFSGGVAPGFTDGSTGGGVPAEEGAVVHSGGSTKAQKLTASTGSRVARVYRDVLVRAGEELSYEAYLSGDGTATVYARAQDLNTGKWWDGSAWQSSVSSIGSRATATYAATTDTITAETAVNLRAGLTTIRFSFVVDGSVATGSGYVDDFAVWPSVDFCGIFGHNIPIGATVLFRSSTSSGWGAPTTQATMTVYQPSFFSVLAAPVAERYWRFQVTDAIASVTPYVGEVVMGSTLALTKSVDYPLETTRMYRHTRMEGPLGHVFVGQRSARPSRVLPLTWGVMSAASLREIRDQLYLAAMGDLHSLIVIPRDDDPELCIYGRLQDEYRDGVAIVDYRQTGLVIVEHPFPVVGA